MESFSQKQINDMLIVMSLEEGHIVRLKGGDPFVFGRGGEEALSLLLMVTRWAM